MQEPLIPQIREAIYELNIQNCKESDLIIAWSPVVDYHIIKEASAFQGPMYPLTSKLLNEIVVYHKNACLYPELVKKIAVSVGLLGFLREKTDNF